MGPILVQEIIHYNRTETCSESKYNSVGIIVMALEIAVPIRWVHNLFWFEHPFASKNLPYPHAFSAVRTHILLLPISYFNFVKPLKPKPFKRPTWTVFKEGI